MSTKKTYSNEEINKVVVSLHQKGMTIAETIKFLYSNYGINLAEAKQIVSNNSAWKSVAEAAKPLHEEIIVALEDSKK